MDLLSGVRAQTISTDRLNTFVYESGPEDGIPVVMIHGNLSTGRFYEHLWPAAPERYRFIGPSRIRGIVVWLVGGGVHVRRSPRAA